MIPNDWVLVAELIEVLDPLKSATKKLERLPSESTATGIADIYPVLRL
jgi:hypothetical protein